MAPRRNRPPSSDQEGRPAEGDFLGGRSNPQNKRSADRNPAGADRRLTRTGIGTVLQVGWRARLGPDADEYTFDSLADAAGLNLPALTIEQQRAAVGWVATLLHWWLHIRALYGDLPFTHIPPFEDDLCVEALVSLDGHRPVCVPLPGPKIFPPIALVRCADAKD